MFECLNFQKAHYFSHTAAENLIFILSINTAKHFSLCFSRQPSPWIQGQLLSLPILPFCGRSWFCSQKFPCVPERHYSPYSTIIKEMSLKLLTGHLKLQTRSFINLFIMHFGSMEVLCLYKFTQAGNSN